jgi:hypothetical protein
MSVSTHTISGIELFDVKQINRATIADGNLLNAYVFDPLTKNEDILASAVGSAYNVMRNKKDKQEDISLSGSATKTVKKITQNENGVVSAEFEDIALTPNIEITSPSRTLDIKSSFDTQSNIKQFEIDVSAKSEIKVYEGTSAVHKDLMTIDPSGGQGALAPITFEDNENSNVCLIKKPVDDDVGKVLMAKQDTTSGNYFEWADLKFNTYSANITHTITNDATTSAMPSAYFDEILQKVKNNENVIIALTYNEIYPYDNSTHTYSLQASYVYAQQGQQRPPVSALEFSTIQKDFYTNASKIIMLRAANSTDWQYSEESLAVDGNYVSAGNNQHLTMVTASVLPETLQQNVIYII